MNKKEEKMKKMLKEVKELLGKNKRLLFTNLKPSVSGMSRTFYIYAQTDNGNIDITYEVATLIGNTYTKNGKMRIYGCGMDMLFETCYQLNMAYIRLENLEYSHDNQYNGLVSTYYDLI